MFLVLPLILGLLACGGGGETPAPPPPVPGPPVISGLTATSSVGYRATLAYQADHACNAEVSYKKAGGTLMTRKWLDMATTRSLVLDLLEPGTLYDITLKVTDGGGLSTTLGAQVTTATTAGTATVTAIIDPATTRGISPYIYGLNVNGISGAPSHLTLDRMGGNRWTAYNWENNASCGGRALGHRGRSGGGTREPHHDSDAGLRLRG